MKVVAFLPAKGSSERVQSKNTKPLNGKPLFLYTLEKLLKCDFIDEVYLDTESQEVIKLSKATLGHKILRRDANLATNSTDGNKLFMNEVNQVEADIYIQVLCTSPFIEPKTILEMIKKVAKGDKYDSSILVKTEKLYKWDNGFPEYPLDDIPNSKDLPDTIVETMGLYVINSEAAKQLKRRIGNNPYLFNANPLEAIDVNTEDEFKLADLIAAGLREKENLFYNTVKNYLSSSILSDVTDEMGLDCFISGLKLNTVNKKILGPAKTLKLRKLRPNENINGIYKALKSYSLIAPNDVILVENEESEYAYFGELNANLAIRAGASAVIIDGNTRDSNEVLGLGFTTFSTGYSSKDIKGRGTVESINQVIHIRGKKVYPGDLVFGDNDGIIVMPSKFKEKILNKAVEIAFKEKSIINDISRNKSIDQIVKTNGFF